MKRQGHRVRMGRVLLALLAAPVVALVALLVSVPQLGPWLLLQLPFALGDDRAYEATTIRGETLRSAAAARGIRIGAAVEPGPLQSDERYAATLRREFSMLTPENVLRFDLTHPDHDEYDFSGADLLVDFAQANAMQVRGAALAWHLALPEWLTEGRFTREESAAILRDHIATVVGRYRGRIAIWHVVNEAIDNKGQLEDSFWLRALGPEYIEMAFRWAHEADPSAKLFYNDIGGESAGPKSDAIYRLVQGLKERNVPIDGVGLQMHTSVTLWPRSEGVAANMRRLATLGVEVHVTEMDVAIYLPVSGPKLARQARIYSEMLGVCLAEKSCKAFVIWGFTDASSWVPGLSDAVGAALPFDAAYQPKPAYAALLRRLREP